MKQNVGNIDRIVRIVIGAAAIAAGFYFQSWWGVIGIIPLATGLMRTCPLFSILGFSTCPLSQKAEK